MYSTYEEAQAAMKADFIDSVGAEAFNQVCAENCSADCEEWQLKDDDAWQNYIDDIDWHIVPVLVAE